jgi:hypothetical protein
MVGLAVFVCLQVSFVSQAFLSIIDEQGQAHAVSSADLAKLPRKTVKATGHDQKPADYEGVQLSDLLQHCGVTLGRELRNQRLANVVLVEAEDGYRVALAIAEVDPATTEKVVLLAEHKNGAPLAEKEGPFRLVIPDEKRPVRWVRMVKRIRVQSVPKTGE